MPRSEIRVSNNLPSYPLNIRAEKVFFVTEQGLQYEVYLAPGIDYLPDTVFAPLVKMLGLYQETTELVGVYDERIRNTAVCAIEYFFSAEPDLVVVYVCDMMDGRQRQRSMLFDRWFREFGEGYVKMAYTDNTSTYCGMIFREGHPYTADLKEAVDLYIRDKEAL